MKIVSKAPTNKCPHCGSDFGYYTKQQVSGTVRYNHNFDGSEAENGEMYECLNYKGGKVAYCMDCNKKVFDMKDVEQY